MCSLDPACDAAGCHPWQGQPGLSDTPRRACSSQASPGTSSPPTGLCALKPGASGLRAEAEAPNRPAGTKPPRSHGETIQSTRRFRTGTTDGVRDTSSRAPAPRDALRQGGELTRAPASTLSSASSPLPASRSRGALPSSTASRPAHRTARRKARRAFCWASATMAGMSPQQPCGAERSAEAGEGGTGTRADTTHDPACASQGSGPDGAQPRGRQQPDAGETHGGLGPDTRHARGRAGQTAAMSHVTGPGGRGQPFHPRLRLHQPSRRP